ncbi:MAG: hypothetical protein ACLRZ9_11410 [Eubacterium sp.]
MNRNTTGEIESEKTNDEYINETQRLIIEMVEKTENLWILKQILQFIQNMTKEG